MKQANQATLDYDIYNNMVGNDLDLNKSFTAPTFRICLLQIGGE